MSTVPSPYHVPFAFLALIPLLVWLVGIVLGICVIIWVFQIRKATRETAEETKRISRTIDDIYQLLMKQSKR